MPSKLFIIACEPSGDSHGAALVRELKRICPDLQIKGLGGPQMAAEGVELLHDMTKLSALGLGDVLRLYFRYRAIFYHALREVELFQPRAIVMIDSPAFNLRFAKKIKKRFPIIYYIAPQIWAWGMRRIHVIKKTVTQMLTILPFEKEIYDKAGVPCEFVGHPLLDHLPPRFNREELRKRFGISQHESAIGLLSGSRKKEVVRIFPLMLETARLIQKEKPGTLFVTRKSPNVPASVYESILAKYPDVSVKDADGSLPEVVAALDFALVASGTATLETALIGTPFFLLYKASWSTYVLGRMLVKVKYLGLANLLAGRPVVPEYIQQDIRPEKIAKEVCRDLSDENIYHGMQKSFEEIRSLLGGHGASHRAALAVLKHLA